MKKSITEAQVKRMRNLITKKYGNKTEIRAGYTKSMTKHSEGDVWEERGKTWTIKNGIKQTVSKLKLARKTIQKPLHCPKCGGSMKHHLNDKMWPLHKQCFKCVIKFETQLRKDGRYEEYEKSIMQGNFDSWLKDVTAEYEEFINTDHGQTFITEAGHIEDWSIEGNDKIGEHLGKAIDRTKKEFEESIDGTSN